MGEGAVLCAALVFKDLLRTIVVFILQSRKLRLGEVEIVWLPRQKGVETDQTEHKPGPLHCYPRR